MCRRYLGFLAIALVLAVPGERVAAAAPASSVHTAITTYGVRLALTLPGRSFPAAALVRATVTAHNGTHHTIWLEGGNPMFPGKSFPQVEVRKDGATLYPPALPWWLPLPGPGPAAVPLRAGRTLRTVTYVVLRGPRVRATVPIMKTRMSFGNVVNLTTPPLVETLTAPDTPQVMLTTTPGGFRAEITPPAGVTGKPLYQDSSACSGTVGGGGTFLWTPAGSDSFAPDCSPVLQWHVVAGWPDHTVATIDEPATSG